MPLSLSLRTRFAATFALSIMTALNGGSDIAAVRRHQVAERLRHCARAGDLVARLGGDEFVIVLNAALGTARGAGTAAGERVIAALGQPFDLDGTAWPEHGQDIPQIMRLADGALYAAKRAGKNRVMAHAPELAAEAAL